MFPDNNEYDTEVPEVADTVDEVQAPGMRKQWSFDTNTVVIIALAGLAASFAIYFLVSYTKAKAKAESEAASNDGES